MRPARAAVLRACAVLLFYSVVSRAFFATALAAGLVYGTSGFLMAHLGHTNVIHSVAWAPLLVWSLERLRQRTSPPWVVLAAVAVACSALAGHPQLGFYTLLLGAAYALAL